MKRSIATLALCCGLLKSSLVLASSPNIVVILADDIGSGDIGYYNTQFADKKPIVNTHAIDAIAEQGVWFTDAHSATALCAPTRYAVMTGKNNYRSYAPWGVWGSFRPNAIKASEPTLGNVVKDAGYDTAFVGKWHLGGDFKKSDSNKIYRGTDNGKLVNVDLNTMVGGGPNDLGFDYSYMLPDGIQGPLYMAYENQQWAPLHPESALQFMNKDSISDQRIISDKGAGMGDSHWDTRQIGDVISQKAADFIEKQEADKPFLLYYASPMAHLPHIPPKSFDGKPVAQTTPSAHLDMVYELDLQVNRIIEALKAKGVYDNTLIIFTSDNGGLEYGVPGTMESGHEPNGIYRGSKNAPHEGGHRVPFIVSWPAQIDAKQVRDEPVLVQDILATIATASGVTLAATDKPDSKNVLPLIAKNFGKTETYNPRQYMMLQSGSTTDVIYREGDWKLIVKSNHKSTKYEPTALFNLADNLTEKEKQNLIKDKSQQGRVDAMLKQYLTIRNSGQPTAE